MTAFIIEHQCPQCGAPVELEETDRLVRCRFCRTNSYLTAPGFFRYTLPHKAPAGVQLIYFPYWRFKGMLFSCLPKGMENRYVDLSHQAIPSAAFPLSLGLRSQTQKLRFVSADTQAIFLKPLADAKQVLTDLTEQVSAELPKPLLHQEFVGETTSLIYAPFFVKDKVIDAVLNQPFPTGDVQGVQDLITQPQAHRWPITFIPTLCPQCGWDLYGQSDSLALDCPNCQSLWWAKQGRLQPLNAAHASAPNDDDIYLPFWRIKAQVNGVALDTYADLIRLANLPKVVQPGWEQQSFYFWAPAFKIRPQNFLTVSTMVTVSQPSDKLTAGPPKGRLQAVNLPLQEATESLKLNLFGFMRPRERMIAKIPSIQIIGRSALLVYLGFQEGHHELLHPRLNLAVNKAMLAHSKNL